MPTIKQVLEKVNLYDSYPNAILYRWLGELDKKTYRYPEDADTELAIDDIDIYVKYLVAMNDFYSCDFTAYAESAMEFDRAYQERLLRR